MLPLHTSLRGLRCFCIAAECLSFKETANQLFLTPSAVSHQIKQLEQNLQQPLFIRQTRAIKLTDAGKQFYQQVAPIMVKLSETVNQFAQTNTTLEVSISMPEFFASELFVPQLIGWSQEYPQINLKLDTVKTRAAQTGQTDLSIVLSGSKQQDQHSHELFPLKYIPACNPHQFQQLHSQGLSVISKVPLIVHQARPHSWEQWAESVNLPHFSPKQVIQLDSMFSVARAAEQGIGIALIPMPISKAWFENGSLVALFNEALNSHDKYYLLQHGQSEARMEVQQLIDWTVARFGQQ
ncbi:LysR family transcriptional regulator [Shewanella sp. UCD-FRSSP16_17]|uniref:LysR substrate-binding domain-containing protein n=1 Tax=Shewanella sp. MMG014 TaxID=2822691 RepID=UPI0007EED238|nr:MULTISPECIES: LysR substrate-binding domain-containing protein [unclassified Shewanella]MBQ4890810.1 LysR family transcriptional regulator [Shewanella sp. MMG014]OBT06723.1 LysR family transcriptional regulator [Shewanella sp. UCD-FRSSP16_17]